MTNLYFECANGISGDMAVGALLDLDADRKKLEAALKSINLDNEFEYKISEILVNSIKTTDFDVILNDNHNQNEHHHHHRNLEDINKIIDKADMSINAKKLAKRIFEITAEAESIVHKKPINEIHFHEIGAIDSIVDVISFSVLFDDINPKKVYFKSLSEGYGTVECAHGTMNVPVPAVIEIVSKYKLPVKLTENKGEMITPTGASIAGALYTEEKLPNEIIIKKVGNGRGKRPYKNPVLRVFEIE